MIKLVIKKNSLKKKELSLGIALLPIIILVILLSYNVLIYGDDALGGSNQFILLIGGAIAGIIGFFASFIHTGELTAIFVLMLLTSLASYLSLKFIK